MGSCPFVISGMGIAFCAKKRVKENSNYQLNQRNLFLLVHLLGISEKVGTSFPAPIAQKDPVKTYLLPVYRKLFVTAYDHVEINLKKEAVCAGRRAVFVAQNCAHDVSSQLMGTPELSSVSR